jgi:hypothetical protein
VRNINHYIERFWSVEDAETEIKRIQGNRYLNDEVKKQALLKMKSTFSQKSVEEMNRINYLKAHNFKDPKKFAEYYNISEDVAIEKYKDRVIRKVDSHKSKILKMGGYRKEWSCRSIDYWTLRGYSKDDALAMVSALQDTRSITSIMKRYDISYSEAYSIQEKISNKCRETFNARPQSEKDEILLKRTSFFKRYSKASSKFFERLMKNIKLPLDIEVYLNDTEYFLWNRDTRGICFYDFTIPKLGIIIEYNGIMFHPRIKDTIFATVEKSKANDDMKFKLAKQNGLDVHYFWEKIDDEKISIHKFKEIIENKLEKYDNK